MTGDGDFSKCCVVSSASAASAASAASPLFVAAATIDLFCCKDCAASVLILLLRLRGVIGLLEADGIFSRTSLGSLQ